MLSNIQFHPRIRQLTFLIFSTMLVSVSLAQVRDYTKPALTDEWDDYSVQVKKDSSKKMVELKSLMPSIVYDLRYASINNFMKRLMYPASTRVTFLRSPAARALRSVQQELAAKNLGLKIFDAYRPWSVTAKFWELVHDERYVANPSKGSGHNRGLAVDLTIIKLSDKSELDMGTGFDNFSDTAHHSFMKLPETVKQNRALLKSIMEKHGFSAYNEEWWHYSWPGSSRYEILDIAFKKFAKHL